ncbi:MAG: 50S ribosomal protein L37e [Promethearchaeota archaeon]
MGKGTPAFGKRNKSTHIRCRRCGKHSYHKTKKRCAACGFGESARLRKYNWSTRTRAFYGKKSFNNRRYKGDNPRF